MAFKSLIAVCLLATYAQGQFYPNYGFGYAPQVQFMRPLPVPQPPRLPGPYQPPPLPQPPLLPVFGPSIFEIPEPLPGSVVEVTETYPAQYPTIFEFNRDGDRAGGSFSGMTISSTSNGKGGVTIISTNDNGKTQTFVSPSPQGDSQFFRIPSSSSSPSSGMARLVEVTNRLMRGVTNYMRQAFLMPDITIPEVKVPKHGPRAVIDYIY